MSHRLNQVINLLSHWTPEPKGEVQVEDLVPRYKALVSYLYELPVEALSGKLLVSDAGQPQVSLVRCSACHSPLPSDHFCGRCRSFRWGSNTTLNWSEVPSVEGLSNPSSAYPIPPKHAKSPESIALWLAACDEVGRLERK